jgi:pimeloyl-ACP methyl ester carboxylesterase
MPVPAILIHGFLDAGAIWAPVVADLGPEAEAWLTPDLAGMGALSADAGRHTLPRYCADITRLIDQTEGSLVLVGHSMGTQVAELAALARPDRIRALVLLSPVPLGGPHAPAEVTGPLAATGGDVAAQREARRGLMASPVDPEILDWLTDLGRAVRLTVIEELVATWNTGVPEGRAPSPFPGPVLVLSGDLDLFVTLDMATAVAGRFAHATQALVKGAGHWPHTEQPEQVSGAIADFLAQMPAGAPHAKAEAAWTGAFSAQSEKSFGDNFDPDVEFEATVLARRVKGRERVQTILDAARGLYEAHEFTHKGKDGGHSFLEWEARIVGGEPICGVTILTSDAKGQIARIAIHHRPLPGALHFSTALQKALAGKIEPDLFYSPAEAATA